MIYENEFNYILQLLKCAVSDSIPPNPTNNLDWEVIFKIAQNLLYYIFRPAKTSCIHSEYDSSLS